MRLSWIFVLILLAGVAIFSVQNAGVITVHFLAWQCTLSAALFIQLTALVGTLIGFVAGFCSRGKRPAPRPDAASNPPPGSREEHP